MESSPTPLQADGSLAEPAAQRHRAEQPPATGPAGASSGHRSPADIGANATMAEVLAPEVLPRGRGVIKSLYSDFIVRELIHGRGTPVALTCLDVPEALQPPPPSAETVAGVSEDVVRSAFAECCDDGILSAGDVGRVVAFATMSNAAASEAGDAGRTLTLPAVDDKAQRTKIHQAVKASLALHGFESATGDGGTVVVQRGGNGRGGAGGRGGRGGRGGGRGGGGATFRQERQWPEGRGGEHLHFTLYKENLDTGGALRGIATKLNINQRRLFFAGTKDKRGVTAQRVSCRFLEASRVAKLNHGQSFGRNAAALFGDFTYEKEGLNLGRLEGNQFTIVVRDVENEEGNTTASSSSASSSMMRISDQATLDRYAALLSTHGFLNYFGPQRFGTTSIKTSDVGRCIAMRDFEGAVGLIFKSKALVVPDFARVVAIYEDVATHGNGRFAAALSACPHFCHDERDMLNTLAASPNNFEGAIVAMPRNTAMLYVHALQSLVWNHALTRRVHSCPRVVAGDLVYAASASSGAGPAATPAAAAGDGDDDKNNDAANDDGAAGDGGSYVPTQNREVRRVTEAEAAAGTFKLCDLLLPVPGPDAAIQYPTHPSCDRAAYEAIAADHGATALIEDSHGLAKRFHFHGTYRHAAVVPGALELRAAEYADPRQLLVETDGMKIRGVSIDSGMRAPNRWERKKASRHGDDPAAGVVQVDADGAVVSKVAGSTVADSAEPAAAAAAPPEVEDAGEASTVEASDAAAPAEPKKAVVCTFSLQAGAYATSLLRELFSFSDAPIPTSA